MFYVDFVEFGKGANLGCSVILQALIQHAQLHGFLPRRLMVQCDNTSADFKNTNTLRFLAYLVSNGIFDEVNVTIMSLQEYSEISEGGDCETEMTGQAPIFIPLKVPFEGHMT